MKRGFTLIELIFVIVVIGVFKRCCDSKVSEFKAKC